MSIISTVHSQLVRFTTQTANQASSSLKKLTLPSTAKTTSSWLQTTPKATAPPASAWSAQTASKPYLVGWELAKKWIADRLLLNQTVEYKIKSLIIMTNNPMNCSTKLSVICSRRHKRWSRTVASGSARCWHQSALEGTRGTSLSSMALLKQIATSKTGTLSTCVSNARSLLDLQ